MKKYIFYISNYEIFILTIIIKLENINLFNYIYQFLI